MACNGKACASEKLLSLTALQLCLLALLLHTISNYTSGLTPSSSHSNYSSPSALSSDRAALQAVAASFSQASPSAHTFFGLHWKPERDCCAWRGVTCSNISSPRPLMHYSFRVVGLNLSGVMGRQSASAKLPRAVCKLSALTSLDLSYNGLVGAVPTCFNGHNLTSLQTLILKENSLSSLPPLANLSRLTHLDLSHNSYDSLDSISNLNLAYLTYLDLSYSCGSWLQLSISFISTLNLPNLTYLDLFWTGVSPSAASLPLRLHNPRLQHLSLDWGDPLSNLSFISGLSDLQYLDASLNSLSSAAYLRTTPLLRHFSVFFRKLPQIDADGVLNVLQGLPHLEILWMRGGSASLSSVESLLCRLRSLKELSLSSDAVNCSLCMSRLPCEKPASVGLTLLDLQGSVQGLTGPFPAWVGHFSRLQHLNLQDIKFHGSIPQEWPQALTQLTHLYLSGDSPSTPVPLSQKAQTWLSRLPLQSLTLRSMGLHSMQCEAGFSLLNQTLEELDLSENQLTASLWHCLQHYNFSRLWNLDLSSNPLALQLQPPLPIKVTQLDLSFCQLSGSLSMDLFPKPSMYGSVLVLAHNNLVGSIPCQIGALGNSSLLVRLDLSHNKLTGLIPPSIWNLSSLSSLVLDHNHLYGEIHVLLGGVISLSAANNYLSKASFHSLSGTMEYVDLSSNQLRGSFEDLLGDYSLLGEGLVVLILFANQLNGSIPTSIGTLASSLITMDLSHNKLTGAIPHSLTHLQDLQYNIGVGQIQQSIPAYHYFHYSLDSVKNVKLSEQVYFRGHLDLSSNQLSGFIPNGLGALLGLHDLNLSSNQLSGPIPPDLANLVFLETLDLSNNNLQGMIPPALANLTTLEVFNVSFNPELSGPIPNGPQLDDIASYEGDDRLCGQVVRRDCGEEKIPAAIDQEPHEKKSIKEKNSSGLTRLEEWVAIPGICMGYVLGVGLTIWGLKLLHFYK